MSEQTKSARALPTAAGPWHVSVDGVDIVVNVRVRKWRGEPDGLLTWVDGEGEPYDVEDERFVWLAPVAPVGSVPPEAVEHARAAERERCIAIARGCTDYRGGYSGRDLEVYHHGIDTVARCLAADPNSMQVRVVEAIGREQAADVVAGVTR